MPMQNNPPYMIYNEESVKLCKELLERYLGHLHKPKGNQDGQEDSQNRKRDKKSWERSEELRKSG